MEAAKGKQQAGKERGSISMKSPFLQLESCPIPVLNLIWWKQGRGAVALTIRSQIGLRYGNGKQRAVFEWECLLLGDSGLNGITGD